MKNKRAFLTEWDNIKSVVFADKAGKARYLTYLSASEAGYKLSLTEIKVKRAPEYDIAKMIDGMNAISGMCVSPEFLEKGRC